MFVESYDTALVHVEVKLFKLCVSEGREGGGGGKRKERDGREREKGRERRLARGESKEEK